MKRQTRSILNELNSMIHQRDRQHVFESRGSQIIESAINLIDEFYEHYDEAVAGDLERRLINSIRGRDAKKFTRGAQKLGESK